MRHRPGIVSESLGIVIDAVLDPGTVHYFSYVPRATQFLDRGRATIYLAYPGAGFGFDFASSRGFDSSAHHHFLIYLLACFGSVMAGVLFDREKLETTGVYAKL